MSKIKKKNLHKNVIVLAFVARKQNKKNPEKKLRFFKLFWTKDMALELAVFIVSLVCEIKLHFFKLFISLSPRAFMISYLYT